MLKRSLTRLGACAGFVCSVNMLAWPDYVWSSTCDVFALSPPLKNSCVFGLSELFVSGIEEHSGLVSGQVARVSAGKV